MAVKAQGMTRAQAERVAEMLRRSHARDIFVLAEGTGLFSVHAVDNQTGYPFGVYSYPLIRIELPQRENR